MAPQLYITMYKEQFSTPGRVTRTQLRPTSAHRRNNPQPHADFLFPLSLKSNYKPQSIPVTQHPSLVDPGRPLFPPIKRLSFHGPVTTFTNSGINTVDKCTQLNMPPDNVSRHLPSVDPRPKLPQTPVYTGNQPHTSAKKAPRFLSDTGLNGRPHTTIQRPRTLSNSTLDYSGCCSCFHVVKPFQAGHYIIHPEFASECLH